MANKRMERSQTVFEVTRKAWDDTTIIPEERECCLCERVRGPVAFYQESWVCIPCLLGVVAGFTYMHPDLWRMK